MKEQESIGFEASCEDNIFFERIIMFVALCIKGIFEAVFFLITKIKENLCLNVFKFKITY